MQKRVLRIRYGFAITLCIIMILLPKLTGFDYNWKIITASIGAPLVLFGWSWFIFTEERQPSVKEATESIRQLAEENSRGTQVSQILQAMVAESNS